MVTKRRHAGGGRRHHKPAFASMTATGARQSSSGSTASSVYRPATGLRVPGSLRLSAGAGACADERRVVNRLVVQGYGRSLAGASGTLEANNVRHLLS